MVRAAEEYPEYQFQKHKGYGTKLHYELLRTYGPQPHPPPVLPEEPMSGEESRRLGRWGEDLAAKFLVGKGYRVLDRNWKCRFGELDLVAEGEGYLCFVEVKLRRTQRFGTGAEQVDRRKREKLRITAELYLQERPAVLQPPV